MASLTAVLGDSPRVRVVEAVVRLAGLDFTRGELADEAGLYRMTTNRIVVALEREGLVEPVTKGSRPRFRTRIESPRVQILGYLDAALGLIEEREFAGDPASEGVAALFREALQRVGEGPLGPSTPRAIGGRGPGAKRKVRGPRP